MGHALQTARDRYKEEYSKYEDQQNGPFAGSFLSMPFAVDP